MQRNPFFDRLLNTVPAQDRRQFLANTGRGLLSIGILGQLSSCASHAQGSTNPATGGNATDTIPVPLKPLDHPSEKSEALPPAPMNPEKRVGIALVGLGKLTLDEILPAFGSSKYAKPVALVSGDRDKATKVAGQYGIPSKNIYNYQNFDDIKNNPDVDVVYIVLPNSLHEEFTVRAARAGKHVLCEKPMTTSSASAQRMIDACKAANRKLMIAYRIQYEPNNNQAKEWVRNKTYGKVRVIEMFNGQNIGDPAQWRLNKKLAGGGSLPDIGLYCSNTARFLTGEEPEWVMATQYSTPGDLRFKEVEETVMWQMGFPGGTVVNAGTSYSVHESRRYRCLADKGGWFGLDPAFAYHGLQMEVSEVRGKNDWEEHPKLPEKNQFALEMDHMALCVLNNQEPFTPGEEGLQDHKIMEAIYQSAKEGKRVMLDKIVKLDAFRGTPPKKDA